MQNEPAVWVLVLCSVAPAANPTAYDQGTHGDEHGSTGFGYRVGGVVGGANAAHDLEFPVEVHVPLFERNQVLEGGVER